MAAANDRIIVVTGATGLQGSAVTRHLLSSGWKVRALTRRPGSERAQELSTLGAEVVQGDMADPDSLAPIFEGAYGVFSVQNPIISGIDGEIRQGKTVADAAMRAGARHLVYGSAGAGMRGTGVPSWESKLVVEDYMKSLGVSLTILRPTAFMELMTEKKFFPAVSTWHVMPALMGSSTKVGWLAVDDLGYIAARAFAEPDRFTGRELPLTNDVRSIDECRALYREVMGKMPPRFPMPVWLFERFGFTGRDLSIMWLWLRKNDFSFDTSLTRSIHPGALDVRAWLQQQSGPRSG